MVKNILASFAVCAGVLNYPQSVEALEFRVIQNKMTDNESSFTWFYAFQGLPTRLPQFMDAIYVDGTPEWGNSKAEDGHEMFIRFSSTTLIFGGEHIKGPHHPGENPVDIAMGDFVNMSVEIASLTEEFRLLDTKHVNHPASPINHSDDYFLHGNKLGETYRFVVTGFHMGHPVPEITHAGGLMALGLAGLLVGNKRFRSWRP